MLCDGWSSKYLCWVDITENLIYILVTKIRLGFPWSGRGSESNRSKWSKVTTMTCEVLPWLLKSSNKTFRGKRCVHYPECYDHFTVVYILRECQSFVSIYLWNNFPINWFYKALFS